MSLNNKKITKIDKFEINSFNPYVEIEWQLDATDDFIADIIACSTCFGHHYAHHQELERVMCPLCGLQQQQPANWTHNPQLHTIPTT